MVYGGRGKSLVLRQAPYLDAASLKSIRRLASRSLGVRDIDVRRDAALSLAAVDGTLERISRLRALAGSRDRLLELRIKGRRLYSLDLQAAEGCIRDVNPAEGISSFLRNHTLLRFEYGVILRQK